MATIDEEIARLQFLSKKGRGKEKCHVVLIEVEQQKRIENAKEKTRFCVETDDPKMYSNLHRVKELWFGAVNKSVALSVWLDLLDRPVEWIMEVCSGEQKGSA